MTSGWTLLSQRLKVVPAGRAEVATALVVRDLEDGPVSLERYAGQVVLVNLWASWCGPCRKEIPVLRKLHETYAEQGLVVLGLNAEEFDDGTLRERAEQLGIDYPLVRLHGPLEGTFSSSGRIPQTWVVDRAGRLRASHVGPFGFRTMQKAVEALLEEPAPGSNRSAAPSSAFRDAPRQ